MFYVPTIVFDGTDDVLSHFHVLRCRTYFRRFRGRWVQFSCFASLYSFSAAPRVSGPVFMFCAPGLFFGGTESVRSHFHVLPSGVGSRFHVLRSRTLFRRYREIQVPFSCIAFRSRFLRYRGRRVSFSCFAHSYLFSEVLRASGHVFMFCASGLIFSGNEGVGSRFNVLRSRTRFRWF
jgi:hypothetical protein